MTGMALYFDFVPHELPGRLPACDLQYQPRPNTLMGCAAGAKSLDYEPSVAAASSVAPNEQWSIKDWDARRTSVRWHREHGA